MIFSWTALELFRICGLHVDPSIRNATSFRIGGCNVSQGHMFWKYSLNLVEVWRGEELELEKIVPSSWTYLWKETRDAELSPIWMVWIADVKLYKKWTRSWLFKTLDKPARLINPSSSLKHSKMSVALKHSKMNVSPGTATFLPDSSLVGRLIWLGWKANLLRSLVVGLVRDIRANFLKTSQVPDSPQPWFCSQLPVLRPSNLLFTERRELSWPGRGIRDLD